jgi:hypothetical protein
MKKEGMIKIRFVLSIGAIAAITAGCATIPSAGQPLNLRPQGTIKNYREPGS